MSVHKSNKKRALRSKLIRMCYLFIEDLKNDSIPEVSVNLLGNLVEVTAKLLGRKKVYGEIREVETVSEKEEAYNYLVEKGLCTHCQRKPAVRETILCVYCHEEFVRLEAQSEFENYKHPEGLTH